MNPYRTPGVYFYMPRSKSEKIQWIISQGWKGTKTALKAMDNKQLYAIICDYRKKFQLNMMRKPIDTNPSLGYNKE